MLCGLVRVGREHCLSVTERTSELNPPWHFSSFAEYMCIPHIAPRYLSATTKQGKACLSIENETVKNTILSVICRIARIFSWKTWSVPCCSGSFFAYDSIVGE